MGKNNQRRRAEKRRRDTEGSRRSSVRRPSPDLTDLVSHLIVTALHACAPGYSATFEEAIRSLAQVDAELVDPILQPVLSGARDDAARAGWRPGETERAASRLLTPRHAMLFRRGTLSGATGSRAQVLRECIQVIAMLVDLQRAPSLGDDRKRADTGLDEKVLAKVRGLLAKAESTEFPDEADALTAKAQELMARYSIDRALLEDTDDGVVSRRIPIDDPYARAKSYLLSQVAAANRCEALWSSNVGVSTVVGHPDHLDACELLYTSLLVQADAAMIAVGRQAGAGARSRSRSFRQSFLVAFAARIGERLMEATTQAEAEAVEEHGASVLPVLAARSEAVEDAFHRAFPHIRSMTLSVNDAAGAVAGRIAADNADLLQVGALPRT